MSTIVKLPPLSSVTPSDATLDGWVVTEGSPTMKTWVLHTASDGTMMAGYWEATPGSYHATYSDAVPRRGVAYWSSRRFRHQSEPIMRRVQPRA